MKRLHLHTWATYALAAICMMSANLQVKAQRIPTATELVVSGHPTDPAYIGGFKKVKHDFNNYPVYVRSYTKSSKEKPRVLVLYLHHPNRYPGKHVWAIASRLPQARNNRIPNHSRTGFRTPPRMEPLRTNVYGVGQTPWEASWYPKGLHVRAVSPSPVPQRNEGNKQSKANYRISIHTGRFDEAGTDGDIYVQLHGAKASTPEIHVNPKVKPNSFAEGGNASFEISTTDVGEIRRVSLRMRPKQGINNWWVHYVGVTRNKRGGDTIDFNLWIKDAKTHTKQSRGPK